MITRRSWTIWIAALAVAGCGLNANDPYLDLPVVSLEEAPPPIAGGTLLGTRDGRIAVVSDPDRDRLVVVDLPTREVRTIALEPRLEPGRLVEDGDGRVYVALRAGGAVLAIDPSAATITARHETCAHPRGLAWEPAPDHLHVACADGQLVTLGPDRSVVRTVLLEPDLRDVVVARGGLLVSRFRSAEVIRVGAGGEVDAASRLPIAQLSGLTERGGFSELSQSYQPGVAVRLASADDGAIVLHQRARIGPEAVFVGTTRTPDRYTYSNEPVSNGTVTWRDPCNNAVTHAAVTVVGPDGRALHTAPSVGRAVVPVDVAVSPLGRVAIAFAGEPDAGYARGPQVVSTTLELAARDDSRGCLSGDASRRYPGQVVGVAFAGEVELVQLREPARLVVDGQVVELGGPSVRDTGHDIFHLDTGGAIACASCHPGGGDDGHVWQFAATRTIRTQPLEGMIGLLPYHRAGDVPSFSSLMGSLQEQMASPVLSPEHLTATERWLARLPPPPSGPAVDADAIARGRALFESAEAGCAGCHAGDLGTDGRSHTLRGERWQTPPLRGVALRGPYLHDGRAPNLRTAIESAGSPGEHGGWSELTPEQRADLEAYVRSR